MKAARVLTVTILLTVLGACRGSEPEEAEPAEQPQTSEQKIEARGAPVRIDGSATHSLAVRQDGTVWAWGHDTHTEIGDGSTVKAPRPPRLSPTQVSRLTDVLSVAAGNHFSLALKSNGTVWAWGYNPYGNLGDNTVTQRAVPVQVLSLTDAVAISASPGLYQSFALKSDGTVAAWGYNVKGALGDNSKTNQLLPVLVKQSLGGAVSTLTDVVAISAGDNHTLALKSNGTVWAWGVNTSGQLGNGTVADQFTAVQVVNLTNAVGISAGTAHSLALRADGTVAAWGDNASGQLGNNSTVRSLVPVTVSGLTQIKSVNAGGSHSLALKTDGTVMAWGANASSQLGNRSTANALVPVAVPGLSGVTAVSGGYAHSHALGSSNGVIWGWGGNVEGQVGDGTKTNRSAPVLTLLTSGTQGVATGEQHTVFVKWDSSVWAWGSNVFGNVGDGTPLRRLTPVPVKSPSGTGDLNGIVAVSSGTHYTLALASNGTVLAWGYNADGQLGDGTIVSRGLPAPVTGLTGIVAIAAGEFHALALRFDGKVFAWGRNDKGQLGDESETNRLFPVEVRYLSKVVAIAAGGAHSLAVQQDGSAYAWGNGSEGQLCDSQQVADYFNHTVSQVPSVVGAIGIAAGSNHSLFLTATGKTWACGDNAYGQLGDGKTTDQSRPVAIPFQAAGGNLHILAGGNMSALLGSSGTVYTWGYNEFGQLGDGSTVNRTVSTQVPNFSGVTDLAVGTWHMSSVRTDGTVWSWGRNNHGQIGDGTQTDRPRPTRALLP